jgi:hypothetical protein
MSTIVTGILGYFIILDAVIDGDNKGILRICGRLYRKEIEFEDL